MQGVQATLVTSAAGHNSSGLDMPTGNQGTNNNHVGVRLAVADDPTGDGTPGDLTITAEYIDSDGVTTPLVIALESFQEK